MVRSLNHHLLILIIGFSIPLWAQATYHAVKTKNIASKPVKQSQAIITHLFHSGFIVQTHASILVFDFWSSSDKKKAIRDMTSDLLFNDQAKAKNLFVFVSHEHSDHFDPHVLSWETQHPNIQYLISPEVEQKESRFSDLKKPVHILSHETSKKIRYMTVETCRSTDSGVALSHSD